MLQSSSLLSQLRAGAQPPALQHQHQIAGEKHTYVFLPLGTGDRSGVNKIQMSLLSKVSSKTAYIIRITLNNTITLTVYNCINQMTFPVCICSRPPSTEKKNSWKQKGRWNLCRRRKECQGCRTASLNAPNPFSRSRQGHFGPSCGEKKPSVPALWLRWDQMQPHRLFFSPPWRSEICEMETVTLRPGLKWVWSIRGLLGQYQKHHSSREKQPWVKRLRDALICHGGPWIHGCAAQVEVISALSSLPLVRA